MKLPIMPKVIKKTENATPQIISFLFDTLDASRQGASIYFQLIKAKMVEITIIIILVKVERFSLD